MPFKIKVIQVDRGFEFYSDLESYCTEKGIRLFVLPTKSPKHNGDIERHRKAIDLCKESAYYYIRFVYIAVPGVANVPRFINGK